MDRGCIADMLASSLMTETAEVQHAADSPSGQEIRRGGELVKLETIPASSLIRASEHFSRAFREQYRRQQHMYAGPGMILARAAFLSTEVVLTDSLLAGLLTGAACEAAQSLVSLVGPLSPFPLSSPPPLFAPLRPLPRAPPTTA